MIKSDAQRWLRLQLIVLAMNTYGCATKPVSVPICPDPQRVPENLKDPAPPSDFSKRAQDDIKSWREQLTPLPIVSGASKP